MDLQFIPRKLVPLWRLKGYAPVPGCTAPAGWAILMQKTQETLPEPVPAPTNLHERFTSNMSRSRSVANTRRAARQRESA